LCALLSLACDQGGWGWFEQAISGPRLLPT
jgi:hypothetical protein